MRIEVLLRKETRTNCTDKVWDCMQKYAILQADFLNGHNGVMLIRFGTSRYIDVMNIYTRNGIVNS